MKKIIILLLMPFCFKAQTYLSKSMSMPGLGGYKTETTLTIKDSLFSIKGASESKYKILTVGTNNNYKISDGVKESELTILKSTGKVKGTPYTYILQVSSSSGPITYFANEVSK